MKKIIAILCFFVLLFGVALCEEVPIPEEPIVNETEPILVEPSLEEETALELTETVILQEGIPIKEIIENILESELESEEVELESKEQELETELEPNSELELEPEPKQELQPELEQEQKIEPELKQEIEPESEPELKQEVEPESEPETIILPREVHITFLKEPKFFGDEVILGISLINFIDEDQYTIFWQYCIDPLSTEWIDINGAHGQIYSFILDKTNYSYCYRAIVKVEE